MRQLITMACCVTALAAPAARAADARRSAGLSAEEIVARNVAARGGLEAWRAVRTLKVSGDMGAGGTTDAQLPFVLYLERPQKSRLELTFAGKTAIQVFDGVQGWKVRPFLNRDDVEPFTAAEARSAAAGTELEGPLVDHARKGTRVQRVGTEKLSGKPTYKLKLTLKTGEVRFVWVDAKTFLEAKVSGEPRKLDGRSHEVAILCRDYRTVSGVKVPYVLETVVQGVKQSHKTTLKAVTVNPAVGEELFAKPRTVVARATGR